MPASHNRPTKCIALMSEPNLAGLFLPGVSAEYVLGRLRKAGGNEVDGGKLANPHSSASLAVNAFGWFHERPDRLPPFLTAGYSSLCPTLVEIEYCARFPWRGGKHPWLDAWVETTETVTGVESKRFEPFRDRKIVNLSEAYSALLAPDAELSL
jgi:hypothetical protein